MATLKSKSAARVEHSDTASRSDQATGLRKTVAERVTATILAALDRGVPPWRKPWVNGAPAPVGAIPLRACGRPYRGVNVLLLWEAADRRGFTTPHWFTFRQALELGASVRKGETATHVAFWGETKGAASDDKDQQDDATDTAKPRPFSRTYAVFNADQIDGLPDRFHFAITLPNTTPEIGRRPDLDAAFARVGAAVKVGGDAAFYNPGLDYIRLPALAAFRDGAQFYATLAHELAHWTGHPSRLARDLSLRFGDARYAAEELVAELASAFVGAQIGLPVDHVESHAAYIGHWRRVLADDPRAILTAASKAQAAADFILDRMGFPAPASHQPALVQAEVRDSAAPIVTPIARSPAGCRPERKGPYEPAQASLMAAFRRGGVKALLAAVASQQAS